MAENMLKIDKHYVCDNAMNAYSIIDDQAFSAIMANSILPCRANLATCRNYSMRPLVPSVRALEGVGFTLTPLTPFPMDPPAAKCDTNT